ncbi:MAG: hypothetical protein CMH52_01830 [Myxococcales bacterium]|nr:hypothetical protein [Myxococcales bacterium]|tara:strand:+ start:1051 stop:1305 length:255 start_codon:yes stop_codon:yes gene_type:complete
MTIDPDFVSILICPESNVKLKIADSALVDSINKKIEDGQIMTRNGDTLTQKVDALLITVDDRRAFQVHDNIPNLLMDDSFELAE